MPSRMSIFVMIGIIIKHFLALCSIIIDHSTNMFFRSFPRFGIVCFVFILGSWDPATAQLSHFGNAFKNPGPHDCYTLTQNIGNQGGAVYNMTPIDLTNSFRIRLVVFLGANDGGADGMAFLLRSNPSLIPVGLTGGSLGISGVADSVLLVEMDTWDNGNNNDVSYDHIAIMRHDVIHNLYNNLAPPVMALPLGGNIEDNKEHELSVTWDAVGRDLKVYFDCELRATYKGDIVNNVFNGNPVVYYGVSAATGGATNLQRACFSPGIDLPKIINASCGDTVITIQLSSEDINCASVDADGTDFRLADSSGYNGTATSVKFLPIKSAQPINCNPINKTDEVKIKLWKPLNHGDYTLLIKKGNNLTSLSPFCSHPDLNDYSDFDVPEFTAITVKVRGNVGVQIDDLTHGLTNPSVVSICLPQQDPFPLLKATSAKAVDYYWSFDGDTIQEIDSLWAAQEGTYTVEVVDQYGCMGKDNIKVYFPASPDFVFDVPPYCDTVIGGDPENLPELLLAPSTPVGGTWEWWYDFGPPGGFSSLRIGDTVFSPFSGSYRLIYVDTVKVPGVPPCSTQLEFELNRETYPPEAPLNVQLSGDLFLCSDNDEFATLKVIDSLLKPNFKAKPGYGPNTPYAYRWYANGQRITAEAEDSIQVNREGKYHVFVKDEYGCVGADTVELKIRDRYPAFTVLCEVLLNGRGRIHWEPVPEAVFYEVSFNNGVLWNRVDTNFVLADQIGSLNGVKVRAVFNDACGVSEVSDFYPCAASVTVPNVFTPNKDDFNEFFYIEALDFFPGSKLTILNRWGKVIYESLDYRNDWDGGDVVEGAYFYILELNDGKGSALKGVITLLR